MKILKNNLKCHYDAPRWKAGIMRKKTSIFSDCSAAMDATITSLNISEINISAAAEQKFDTDFFILCYS